jgi:hypothetical protein
VAELTAVHGPAPAGSPGFDRLLGPYLAAVRERGLSVLPQTLLRQLLTQPSLLLALQGHVLSEGGPYWDRLLQGDPGLDGMIERGRRRLEAVVASGGAVRVRSPDRPTVPRSPWYARPWLVSLATAAAVLLAVGVWNGVRPSRPAVAVAWGWDRPGALPQDVSADVYLSALADGAEQWFNKRPETAEALARRILQFRQGCSRLLLAEHAPPVLPVRAPRPAADLGADQAALRRVDVAEKQCPPGEAFFLTSHAPITQ